MTTKKECKICKHKYRKQIEQKLLNGDSISSIERIYKVSRSTVRKHRDVCFKDIVEGDKEVAASMPVGNNMLEEIRDAMKYVNKIVMACDKYLQDPDNPEEYFVGPRAHDIDVVYSLPDDQRQKKASLQELISSTESKGGFIAMSSKQTFTQPTDLLIKAVDKLEKTAKLVYEQTQKQIEWEFRNQAIKDASGDKNSTITFEETIKEVTKRVTIARKESNSDELSKIAGLPEIS